MKEKEEKPIWSADGIALRNLKKEAIYWTVYLNFADDSTWDDTDCDKNRVKPGNVFKTEKRAELERDRREVDYIMKKMACESREDNDWKRPKEIGYRIIYDGFNFFINSSLKFVEFNQAYFNAEQDAQKCLEFLLKKYTKERLKKIWGIKNGTKI